MISIFNFLEKAIGKKLNKMENKFKKAIEMNELTAFFLGKDNYFIPDRDYGDHSVIQSWNSYILPFIEINPNNTFFVGEMFEEVLRKITNCNADIENYVTYHLFVYYSKIFHGKIAHMPNEELIEKLAREFYVCFYQFNENEKVRVGQALIEIVNKGGPNFIPEEFG